ncbi:MAG: N-6 DNA methylase [Nitrospinae bacterium]|nr:N-6 DNA methylase [Nitrospinota bacterium]
MELYNFYNQGLFSNNYLEYHLPHAAIWVKDEDRIKKALNDITSVYEGIKGLNFGSGEEANIEDKFIRPVLKILGYEWDVQPVTQRGIKKKRPDYALFKDRVALEEARREKDNLRRFFSYPLTILEAKYWGRRLNDADPEDRLDSRDPTAQTVKYLDDVYHASEGKIQWAILTNGKLWRLFYYRASSRAGNFYEVDLENILRNKNPDAFKYFYLFFSRDAFISDTATGKTYLDQHLKGSEDYAARVSEQLKDLVFDKVFEGLAGGFIEFRRTERKIQKESEKSLKDIFSGCLTLLYRLLFLLYAESRSLLPVDDQSRYYKKSLKKLKEDIVKDINTAGIDDMSRNAYDYWSRLESLCRIVDKGDKALNIPIYNGGLFETPPDGFLYTHKISDPYLAEAVYLLTVDQQAEENRGGSTLFIDYSSLGVRHLGDIYEGLLEFHIRIADEPMVEVKEKNKSLWKNGSEIKEGGRIDKRKKKGEIYIENSKHERKSTGSYYTPHYVVEYIVKNTVGSVLDERFKRAEKILSKVGELYEKQRKQLKKSPEWKHWQHSGEPKGNHITEILNLENSLFETIFDIKVLDPAMGSGHFLVHTVDFISDRIITFLTDYPENPVIRRIDEMRKEILKEIGRQGVMIDESKLTEVNLIKRTVMKRCIYGVDLNEMAVELAKLSLWLDSFTLGAPLSFLDHHLKWGNSLIGTDLEALEKATEGQLFTINLEPLKRAIREMLFVSSLSDATYYQVKDSAKKYMEADTSIQGYRILLDMLISEYFGIKEAKTFLLEKGTGIDLNNLKKSLNSMHEKDKKVIESIENIAHDKKFFHWEIEFPEVFYERVGDMQQKVEKKESPGFDCVIGNPPYGATTERNFIKNFYPATLQNSDVYSAFMEHGFSLLKLQGLFSFIVPVSWQTGVHYNLLRKDLLEKYRFDKLINLPFDIFKDAYIDTGIFVFERSVLSKKHNQTLIYEFPKQVKVNNLDEINYFLIKQNLWEETNQIILNAEAVSIVRKLTTGKVVPLSEITISARGVLANNEHISANKKMGLQPFFDGELFRYEIDSPNKFISYTDDLPEYPSSFDFFTGQRILVRRLVSRQDRLMACLASESFVNKKDIYIFKPKTNLSLYYLLPILNSKLLSYVYLSQDVVAKKDDFRQTTLEGIRNLPIPLISFTTPEKERAKKVSEAVALYKDYMLNLQQNNSQGVSDEKTGISKKYYKKVEGNQNLGRKEKTVSGKYPETGKLLYGIRGRTGKHKDVERVSEDSEKYRSTTRFIESSLGIKSYTELAPHLAKAVEKVMAHILNQKPDELIITSEFIRKLHRDAFGELFPSWAGKYRDRDVTVGNHTPPPYFEVPAQMQQYCNDLELRLASLSIKPVDTDMLFEALTFAEGRFLSIHPFLDFNGRVVRMLLFALLYKFDLPPVQLVPDEKNEKEKEEYLKALSEADKFNWHPLVNIWKRRLE